MRDFDDVSVEAGAQVTLDGKSYYGDDWNIKGTLNTNNKTIHSYKNSTLNLTVENSGTLTNQFKSDANVNAINNGSINGISSTKNITLTNTNKMTGNYTGSTVNITNTGTINSQTGQVTSISSQNPGILNNNGQIKETLNVSGAVSINNNTNGVINAKIQNNQSILNIENSGKINSSVLNNNGNNQINLVNKSGGSINDSLSLNNGTLNLTNNAGGMIVSAALSANNGTFNISNAGKMTGSNSLSSNSGSINFANAGSGEVSGNLTINSGVNNFSNAGLFKDLTITNKQDITLNNNTDYNDIAKSTSQTDSYRPFAYINYNSSQWRFDLAGGWGKHKIKNNRKYIFDDNLYLAKSKYDSEEFSAHFSAGYRFYLEDNLILQPVAGVFASNIKTDTYEETGNGPMNMHVESEDYNSVKTMLGIKAKKEYKLENGMVLKPEVHVRWYHEMADTNGGVSAYFLAQQELFEANGIEASRDLTDVAFRLTTENDETYDIFVETFYQFGEDFYNIGGTIGLKYNF